MKLDEAITQLEDLTLQVRRASLFDDKTPLGNLLALERESLSMNTSESNFQIVVFRDLNDFKQLNDEHGHDVGDVAINKVGEAIYRNVVEDLQCKAFRRSGDEFVLLLMDSMVERFLSTCSGFSTITFAHNEKSLSASMSIGYARGDGKTGFADLLQRAELACQQAKTHQDASPIQWTTEMGDNPLVRRSAHCLTCSARITANIPKLKAPATLRLCPCCGQSL